MVVEIRALLGAVGEGRRVVVVADHVDGEEAAVFADDAATLGTVPRDVVGSKRLEENDVLDAARAGNGHVLEAHREGLGSRRLEDDAVLRREALRLVDGTAVRGHERNLVAVVLAVGLLPSPPASSLTGRRVPGSEIVVGILRGALIALARVDPFQMFTPCLLSPIRCKRSLPLNRICIR